MSFIVYKQPADLYKLVTDANDGHLGGYTRIFQGLKINIQPAGLEYVVTQPEGSMGKIYRGFTHHEGCQIGMRIVTSGSLSVSGMWYDIIGLEDHRGPLGKTFELLLRKSTN